MKSVQEGLRSMDFKHSRQSGNTPIAMTNDTPGVSEQSAEIVNQLFAELKSIFPAWKHSFPEAQDLADAKRTWTKAFIENRVKSMQQVQQGLRKARGAGSPHFPSVGQFIKWCQPEPSDFGLPDEREAYFEALANASEFGRKKWSHPAVFVASRATTTHVLKSRPEKDSFAVFQRNYKAACKRVFAGEDLSHEIPKALPKKVKEVPCTEEMATKSLSWMRWKLRKKLKQERQGSRH